MGPLGLIKAVLSLLALSGQSLIPRPQALYPLGGLGATVAANSPFACIDTEEFMDFFASPEFWLALGQIIIIDILLGGDNAVVIALACRKLPPAQRTKGIIWGTAGAIVLRVILIAFAMTLLALPFLKFVGALLLVWIGVKLLAPDEEGHGDVQGSDKLLAAIKTIIVADLVMSVDNVIAIAGAAQNAGEHQFLLVVLGLLISIPIIVWGSQLVIKLMERFPMIITAGGMLLGGGAGGGRHAAGLDRWRHAGDGPCFLEPRQVAVDAETATDRHDQVRCQRGGCAAGSAGWQDHRCAPRGGGTCRAAGLKADIRNRPLQKGALCPLLSLVLNGSRYGQSHRVCGRRGLCAAAAGTFVRARRGFQNTVGAGGLRATDDPSHQQVGKPQRP